MKKSMHLLRKVLFAATAVILVTVTVKQIIWFSSPVRAYSKFLYSSVPDEDRAFAEHPILFCVPGVLKLYLW